MICFQSSAVLPSLKQFFNVRRQLHSAEHPSSNQQCTGRFKFVAVLGGCIVWLQEQSSQFRLLIAMSTCDVDQAASATSAAQCVAIFGIMESVCLHLCIFACSPLGVAGFPTVAYIFLLLLSLVPHVWWFNKTELSCYFNGLDLPGMFPFLLEHLHLH